MISTSLTDLQDKLPTFGSSFSKSKWLILFVSLTPFLDHIWAFAPSKHVVLGFDGAFLCLFSPLNVSLPGCFEKVFVAVVRRDSLAFRAETRMFSALVLLLKEITCAVRFPHLHTNSYSVIDRSPRVIVSSARSSASLPYSCGFPQDVASYSSGFRVINYTSRGDQRQLIGERPLDSALLTSQALRFLHK